VGWELICGSQRRESLEVCLQGEGEGKRFIPPRVYSPEGLFGGFIPPRVYSEGLFPPVRGCGLACWPSVAWETMRVPSEL
jgi:hypothetical protein